jgi:hypothetical protein
MIFALTTLILTGINLIVILFMLIALNGFFCYVKIPILAFPIVGITIVFLIGFSADFNAFDIILTLILIAFMLGNMVTNWNSYKK